MGTRCKDRNVVMRSGKRDSEQKLNAFDREWGRERPGGHRGWELGRRMGGWWLGGSEGGCRQDQRAVLVRAFEGRWRSGIEGTARENGAREGRVVVHTERSRESGWLVVVRMEPTGRRVAMLRGWRRQRANLIFAPLAMPLPLLPVDPSPPFLSRRPDRMRFPHA